jgi:polyhydroxybutyrate depolymerase
MSARAALAALAAAMIGCSSSSPPEHETPPPDGPGGSGGDRSDDPGSAGPAGSGAATAGAGASGPASGSGAGGTPPAGPCQDQPGVAGVETLALDSGGLARTAIVAVPTTALGSPAPLVVALHPLTQSAQWMRDVTQLEQAAEAAGMVVVFPEGIEGSWNGGDCCGAAADDEIDDIQFVRDVVAAVQETWCIDPARVHATGFSNGGFLSHRLACQAADVFASVAPVSGVLGIEPDDCNPPRPVPVMHFHGTADEFEPYEGGSPPLLGFLGPLFFDFRSVEETIMFWRDEDGCSGASSVDYDSGDTTCESWKACDASSQVTLCTIDGGGHTWPGGVGQLEVQGKTSQDVDATARILEFFAAHPMP